MSRAVRNILAAWLGALATTALAGAVPAGTPPAGVMAETGDSFRVVYDLPPPLGGGLLRREVVDLIAVPVGASVGVDILEAIYDDLGSMPPAGLSLLPRARAVLPGSGIEIETPIIVRHLMLARLRVAPVSFDAADRRWKSLRRVDLRIRLSRVPSRPAGDRVTLDAVDLHLASQVLNPGDVADATTRAGVAASAAVPAPEPSVLNPVKVLTREDGLYRITRDDLLTAGADPSGIDPHTFVLTHRGVEVPIEVTGESDGSFDSADVIRFYGTAIDGDETWDNVYRLTGGIRAGRRMSSRAAQTIPGAPTASWFSETVHRETDSLYFGGIPGTAASPWLWESLATATPGSPVSTSQTVTLHGLRTQVASAGRLDVRLQSRRETPETSPNHHVRTYINGHLVADETWTGLLGVTLSGTASQAWLHEGANDVLIENPSDLGLTIQTEYTDSIDLSYPRGYVAESDLLRFAGPDNPGPWRFVVSGFTGADILLYDVADDAQPAIITQPGRAFDGVSWQIGFDEPIAIPPGRYLALRAGAALRPAALVLNQDSALRTSAAGGADLLIIAADEFASAVEPLAALRRDQGMRVVVARLTDVYDEFNGGIAETDGIRNYVQWAFENYASPAPSSLLLVGDATYDPKDNKGQGDNYLPTRFFQAAGFGYTPSDTWFAAVTGPDPVPDLAVGRMTARSVGDVAIQLTRILDYETMPPVVDLNSGILYAADDDDPLFSQVDDDLITAWHPPAMAVRRVYLRDYPRTSAGVAAARNDLRMHINTGSLATVFAGHGSRTAWASESLWSSDQVPSLAPTGRLTFVVALDCVNGYFANLDVEPYSLAESWTLVPDRGAIAVWAPSALSTLGGHESLASDLFAELFGAREESFGRVTWLALLDAYLTQGIDIGDVQEMIFFGDPTTRVPLDWDRDGLIESVERSRGTNPDDADSDDDGLGDGSEPGWGADTDMDGLIGALDPDSDNDGLPDGLESGSTHPLPSTDVSRGNFVADTDPSTITDPLSADSDHGGAPDGAEDRNANGRLDAPETDPTKPTDDPTCAVSGPGEVTNLVVTSDGGDLVLSWDAMTAQDPCVLYKVYVAKGGGRATGFEVFGVATTTGRANWRHVGAAVDGQGYTYLVSAISLAAGEGPLGHFGR